VKKQLNPAVVAVVLVIAAVVVVALGYRVLAGPKYQAETKGSEDIQKKYQETGVFYQPPPQTGVSTTPGANQPPGGVPGGGTGGFYQPPPQTGVTPGAPR
jgi:hypothetical protein